MLDFAVFLIISCLMVLIAYFAIFLNAEPKIR